MKTYFSLFLIALSWLVPLYPDKKSSALMQQILLKALKKGENKQISRLLTTIDPNFSTAGGITPLMVSAFKANLPATRQIIQKATLINAQTHNNSYFDEDKGVPELAKLLCSKTSGTSALMLAAYSGNLQIVKLLLERQANINLQDSQGNTALIYAILGDKNWPHRSLPFVRKAILHLLLDNGANPALTNHDGLDAAYFYSIAAQAEAQDENHDDLKNDEIYRKMHNL